MFCPNCGMNCKNANFCARCGQNLTGITLNGTLRDTTKRPLTKRQMKDAAEATGLAYCPKCFSTSVDSHRRGYSMLWGLYGMNQVMCTCLKCGHKWKAGK